MFWARRDRHVPIFLLYYSHMQVLIAQKVASALVIEASTGPIWWYTAGFAHILAWFRRSAVAYWQRLCVGLWARNLLVPMYSQYDWWGRIISFLIRLAQVIARSVWYGAYLLLLALVIMAWPIAPIAVVYFLFAPLF